MFSPEDPTQVVQMMRQYKSSVRHSTSGTSLSKANKRSLATRLAFDDSVLDDGGGPAGGHSSKISRIGSDPFSSTLGVKRFPSENYRALSSIQQEKENLMERVKQLEGEVAGARAHSAGVEARLAKVRLELGREKLEREAEKERLERGRKMDQGQVDSLHLKIRRMKEQEVERHEEGSRSRHLSLDKSNELEMKVGRLREEKARLEEQLTETKLELVNKPDVDKLTWIRQVQQFQSSLSELELQKKEQEIELRKMENKAKEGEKAVKELGGLKSETARAKTRIDRLEAELKANQEAVLQRKAMKDKLERFSELERENVSLRNTNRLLVDTAANSALQLEQISQLTKEKERLEGRMQDVDVIRAQLEVARMELGEWSEMVRQWMTSEQREELGGTVLGLLGAKELVRSWQAREVEYVSDACSLRNQVQEMLVKGEKVQNEKSGLEAEVVKVRGEQVEQTKLVKKLQRKLLLVTKERDSYKGVLDSYEKEITLSGQEMGQERVMALERNLEEYRAVVEMLEEERGVTVNMKSEDKILALEQEIERLNMELERRTIKGDFNPADTRVLHFHNNPRSQAAEKKAKEMTELGTENEALKARVKLLEDGQTRDLTMLVGQKIEEGEGSQKVQELKEQLTKADLKKQRLMEAFKKTSHEFREIVYQLTGYRIDVLADHKYRLLPLYAESPGDSLLFQKSSEGEICMLEAEFSLELGDLMEEHLEKHNSIPMFLAGLITQLFHKQEGSEDQSEPRGDLMSNENSAGGSDICIDD